MARAGTRPDNFLDMSIPRFTNSRAERCAAPPAAGVTLVELLVAVGVAAVLLTVCTPGFTRLLHSVRLSTTSNALLSSLRLARSEAVRRGGQVAICRSADGLSCAASGGWEQGWLVFHDVNGNGQPDAGEPTIERAEAVGGLVVYGTQQVSGPITFNAMAGSRTAAGALVAGTFTLCRPLDAPAAARQIVIGSGGRARVVQVTLDMCL